ncbi:glycosyl hydrolase family 18 protein [Bacillus sp. DTU_2020_1000418_1_SI_GHA_SEK_038]|uniref:glycosyl hydrolase family 18 protein n=1 Tax=Bacillus sp. DTU_2020_1000418_1_SI_GHA_SEK_038 TaxID=3077585 RepID=UPI0028EB9E6E|nr:glycosyl hydrolase family 18 protein [Bacillus sp. DTU_2020_1000418_1_SI_GHA_SEK_038]WNS77387.1 glycosyl hydrolase family 18 protein [Bacillus sp. DTU_2020_1000418_1_SI_GHA_SEK_038]
MARVEFHKKKPLSMKWIAAGLLFSCFLIISSIIFLLYPFASKETESYFQGENPILYEGVQSGNAIIEGNSVYLPISFIQENFDDAITFDEKSNSVIITTKNKVVQMPSESLTYYVNEEPVQLHFSVFKNKDNDMYLAIDPLLTYYPFQYTIMPGTNAIWIKENDQEILHAKVINKEVNEEKLRLRVDASLKTPYTGQVENGEKLFIEGEKEDYYFARKENGVAGYIKKDYLTAGETEKVTINRTHEEVVVPKIEGPIQLTWEAVYTKNPDTSQMPMMPGVNVISPTWFELGDRDGGIKNLGSLEFVNWAQNQGYQVWGLFSNAFDPVLTHEAFKNFETRQKMIRQLLHFSQIYQLNGINLDIENVNLEDGPLITQFVREAVPYFHEAGLVVSMDITFISTSGNWSAFYERDKLANLVDYMVVMAYDEHWGTSPKAGSVASLPWVEENLKRLLEVVPNDRLILGVPLYARLWEQKDSGEVSSKALSMAKVKQWLKANELTPVYDEASGQNYAELYSEKEQTTYKIWLEDELSLKKRADLAKKYNLAGVASWSRYFADESAWAALSLGNEQLTKK